MSLKPNITATTVPSFEKKNNSA